MCWCTTLIIIKPKIEKKSLDWDEVFAATSSDEQFKMKKERKLTIYALSEDLSIPKENVRRKVKELCNKKY